MSFDIIILKPKPNLAGIQSLEDIEETDEFGTASDTLTKFEKSFKKKEERFFSGSGGYLLDLSFLEDMTESIHMSLHFGDSWDDEEERDFHRRLELLCNTNQWAAFSVSDNERVA